MDSYNCQTLNFSRPFFPNNFALLEVDKSLADAFSSGRSLSLTVRGRPSDPLVVCTSSRTFGAKDVEVSNTLLLVDETQNAEANVPNLNIVSITNHFVELSEVFPNQTFRLKALLKQNVLDFYDENAAKSKGVQLSELLEEVQISEQQLENELSKFAVIKSLAEGLLHLLSENCQQKFLDELVNIFGDADKVGMSISAFSADLLRQKVSAQVTDIDWFCRLFCEQNDDGTFCVCPSKFVRCRAEAVLRSSDVSKQWRVDEFEQCVRHLLPDAFHHLSPSAFLNGIALLSESLVYGKTLRALLPDTLPPELGPRLAHLFTLKTAWKRNELQPYVVDFCPNPAKMEELLLKHCKIVGNGSERSYIYRQM